MLRREVKEEKHLGVYGGVRVDIGMKTYLHGEMDMAKKLKLGFRVGDLDLPEKGIYIYIYQKSGGGGRGYKNMCQCGTTIESRAHIVGENVKYTMGNGCVRGGDEQL